MGLRGVKWRGGFFARQRLEFLTSCTSANAEKFAWGEGRGGGVGTRSSETEVDPVVP